MSAKEVQATVSKVIDERDQLAAEREQLKQVVEAARRERVLAIDERDKLLHRCVCVCVFVCLLMFFVICLLCTLLMFVFADIICSSYRWSVMKLLLS